MKGTIGFRVVTDVRRPALEQLKSFDGFGTPQVADVLGRFGGMDCGIKPVAFGMRVVGPAITALLRPGDNLMAHKAIDVAQPGDVIVIDGRGNTSTAVWGELMTTAAKAKGIAGMVIDGAVRDVGRLRVMGFPVFARAAVPTGTDKDGPGEVNTTISCAGVTVRPGDVIFGDDDGVVVVPLEVLDTVIVETKKKVASEEKRLQEIAAGVFVRPDIDKTLREKGII